MSPPSDNHYKSKVDWWLAVILLGMVGLGIASVPLGIWHLLGGRAGEGWTFLGSGLFTFLLFGLLVWPVRYTLTADTLIIRFGVVRSRLSLESITGAERTNNPLSAPALSLARLKISHTGKVGMALISPADRERFMRDLADRCDHLQYQDGKVGSAPE